MTAWVDLIEGPDGECVCAVCSQPEYVGDQGLRVTHGEHIRMVRLWIRFAAMSAD
jgi:hypothetical protein